MFFDFALGHVTIRNLLFIFFIFVAVHILNMRIRNICATFTSAGEYARRGK